MFSPLYHIDFRLDVDQEPAGPQVYLMSMSLTTEPPNDGPTVTEGFIYLTLFFQHKLLCITCPCAAKVCVSSPGVNKVTYGTVNVCNTLETALRRLILPSICENVTGVLHKCERLKLNVNTCRQSFLLQASAAVERVGVFSLGDCLCSLLLFLTQQRTK